MMQVEEDAFVDDGPRLSSGAAPGDAFLMGDSDDGERWDLGGRKVATSMERRPRPQQASAKRQLPQERLLPMNGQLLDDGRVGSLVVAAMPVCPPLNIRLRTTPLRELQIRPRWALVCTEDTIIQYYGTLRRTSATHATSGALTVRNRHELPQCQYFDKDF